MLQTEKHNLKIKIRERHSISALNFIIRQKNPKILIIESSKPKFNNKAINFAQHFASKGWDILNTRFIKRNTHKNQTINLVSITIKSKNTQSLQSGETHYTSDSKCDAGLDDSPKGEQ